MRNVKQRGLTLIELLVVIAILSILASAVLPLSRMAVKRVRENELRQNLRIIRSAIDAFRKDCDPTSKVLSSDYCKAEFGYYPESLELLTEPLKLAKSPDRTKKYLRRIPRDPMTPLDADGNPNNWALRSYADEPDSNQWGGDDVYDVYSKSDATAIDGSKYNTW